MSYSDDVLIALATGLACASLAVGCVVWRRGDTWDG
jgi:hypothetical protein